MSLSLNGGLRTIIIYEVMTQDERWIARYKEVMEFMEKYHRNLSKYNLDERQLYTWVKHQRKVMNQGELKEPRLSRFRELMELSEKYKRVNQYK